MIVSPPFLRLTDAPACDAQSIEDAMPGDAIDHGGIRIHAPSATEPVRAIADGTVVYRRENKPLTYQGTAYATGCVVIRHTTEIGAITRPDGTDTLTSLTYYSITLHLASLDKDLPALNQPIWRKDRLGLAGNIAGEGEQIHLEIVCGDEDIQSLVGRRTGRLALEQNGRVDALYGTVYVFVPSGAALHAAQPAGAPGSPSATTAEDLVIGIDYASGDARLTTWRLAGGAPVGVVTEPGQSEYRLYDQALERHHASPAGSSPSGWHELMRLGRKLGPDPLPADAPHWRRIQLPDGSESWIDLNAAATRKYSDADFPHWRGWRLVDGDTTADGCPTDADTSQTRMHRLCASVAQERPARTICKLPTEWSREDAATRWQWAKEAGNPCNPEPLSASARATFVEFAQALCFWEGLPETDRQRLGKKHWHFHPREFITHMRKCSWLSESEFRQILPTHVIRDAGEKGYAWERVHTDLDRKAGIFQTHRVPQNYMMRRYGINTPARMAAYFGNSIQGTQWWEKLHEEDTQAWYFPWDGRGFLQLTHPCNYMDYWRFKGRKIDDKLYEALKEASRTEKNLAARQFPDVSFTLIDWRSQIAGGFESRTAEEIFCPSDSAGFHWIRSGMARYADETKPVLRRPVQTDDGERIHYHCESFWDASACVDLPGSIGNYAQPFNRYVSKCIPWAQALSVLSEMRYPGKTSEDFFEFPEKHAPRRK